MSKFSVKNAVAGGAAALALGATGALAPGLVTPAAAATVNGCAQSWSEYVGTCIWVTTGSKNFTNRTQWVGTITVQAPRNTPANRLEAWAGNGPTGVAWYRSTTGTYVTWTINKWIKNGSGICGAYSGTSPRSIACITIRV